jgi:hypothetical protein
MILWQVVASLARCQGLILAWIIMGMLPVAMASSDHNPFPRISFRMFSEFVDDHFSSGISLSTVLVILFSLTENPDLLNLHARQGNPVYPGENNVIVSGWIKALARGLFQKLGDTSNALFQKTEGRGQMTEDTALNAASVKLDALAKILDLYPYDKRAKMTGKLKSVSHNAIEPVHMICPDAMECETMDCSPRSLLQGTKWVDVPRVRLVKGTTIHEHSYVLSGKCPKCQTIYHADHERALITGEQNRRNRVYVNSAKYLKVGRNLWVDRIFSKAVLNGMYSFHASAAAYAEFWSNSFSHNSRPITRRQIWHAFVQESVRYISMASSINLELQDGLAIDEVTKEAFNVLGEDGIIRVADGHQCSECTQPYKTVADIITADDPAALVGVDEQREVPVLDGEGADLAVQDAARARLNAQNPQSASDDMDVDRGSVTMAVLDGIVMGPPVSVPNKTRPTLLTFNISIQHCSFGDCTSEVLNNRGGVFCGVHEVAHGAQCRVRDCGNRKVTGTQTCQQHREVWHRHVMTHGRQRLEGYRRALNRGTDLPWVTEDAGSTQPHDEDTPQFQRGNYLTASRFYCVETICAPCGVVIAWTKFAKSESPTKILQFLDRVYPSEDSRPDYICIDKACLVLRTSISNGTWNMWKKTSRFIVDSYHYVNHRTSDYLCRKWCNPAPLNGSAPNLVIVENDRQGQPHYKRAFNTQVRLLFTCIFWKIQSNLILVNRLVSN